MSATILRGAEAASFPGGPGGVLVLHGFTGSPHSVRPWAEAIAADHGVEMPLLAGHGTTLDDLIPTRWADWVATAEAAYERLTARCDRVAVVGLSMGGTIALWLAAHHRQVAAVVTVNAPVEPGGGPLIEMGHQLLEAGTDVLPAIGSDIAREGIKEVAYDGMPVAAMISMVEAVDLLAPLLPTVSCPALVFTSGTDHVVPPSAGDYLATHLGGTVEQVALTRSFHVATLDFDAELIAARTVAFLAPVLGSHVRAC